jgi:hypothetical protein
MAQTVTFICEILFNFVLPWACYHWAKPHYGEVHAIFASALPPMLWSVITFIRDRRIDAISLLVIGGIGLSLVGFAVGGSPKLLLVRESFVTGLIGVLALGSAAIGKPLIYHLARAIMARQSPAEHDAFVARRDIPAFKRSMMVMTVVWGVGLLGEMGLRVALVFTVPVGTYLVLAPVVGYGVFGVLGLWTFLYVRARKRRDPLSSEA